MSDQQWSRHQGAKGDAGRKLGNGSWSYLHSLRPRASGWGMMTMNVLTSAISSNIQHPAPGPRHAGVCLVARSSLDTHGNRSRTSWCWGRGGLLATWPDMNTLDLNGSVSYEFVSTSAIQRLAAYLSSAWVAQNCRDWPTQNMRHAVTKYNDWHPMYYYSYFTVLAPLRLFE